MLSGRQHWLKSLLDRNLLISAKFLISTTFEPTKVKKEVGTECASLSLEAVNEREKHQWVH